MKQYSFLIESKSYPDFCTEEDCEMIPFAKVAKDIQNSYNEDDVTGDIRNAIDYLENNCNLYKIKNRLQELLNVEDITEIKKGIKEIIGE